MKQKNNIHMQFYVCGPRDALITVPVLGISLILCSCTPIYNHKTTQTQPHPIPHSGKEALTSHQLS